MCIYVGLRDCVRRTKKKQFYNCFSTGQKEQLYAGWWDYDGDGTLSQGWPLAGPVYGAPAWEPIYCHVGYDIDADGQNDHYDPALEAQYIATDYLYSSGGCGFGWACPGAQTGSGAGINYPYMTATLFTDYLGYGVLPDDAGIATGAYQAVNWTGASSVVWQMSKPNSSADTFTWSRVV